MSRIPIEKTGMITTLIICCILALFIASPINQLLGFRLAACFGFGWFVGRNHKTIRATKTLNKDAWIDLACGVLGGLVAPIIHGLLWVTKTYIVDYQNDK